MPRILCPQSYEYTAIGIKMSAVPCDRCRSGWDGTKCTVTTGVESWDSISNDIPECPISDLCQHQRQIPTPCGVRLKGMVCLSALEYADIPGDDPRWGAPFADI